MSSKHWLVVTMLSLILSPVVQARCTNSKVLDNVPDERYSVNGVEVTDAVTGLIWQRCSLGQVWSDPDGEGGEDGTCTGNASAMNWALALGMAESESGGDWRIPNLKELRSLVRKCVSYPGPTINAMAFPGTVQNRYWTSTPFVNSISSAWVVYFDYGGDGTRNRYDSNPVRLVRGGQ